ncbi:secreted and transmembrane protein 1 [Erinaceus europaeus]|uniref:Secreted and transmembrane protein 1 n=1 Tax=Erinaceus europaeus TaxID=9365 RepID=A0A1S2ZU18_ERIEU|nr:secreted and transmembrane protein 1 [Erinaceus europaeus]
MASLGLPLLALRALWILPLLTATLRAQNKIWDDPVCTENVSVTSGHPAVMSCNISNPFKTVSIFLNISGRDLQPLFIDKPPGYYSEPGRQFWVAGGMAQLVIEEAWDSHKGQYIWNLQGQQRNILITSLNVSESIDLRPSSPETKNLPVTTATFQGTGLKNYSKLSWNESIILVCIVLLVTVMVLACIAWHKSRGPSNAKRLLI